MHKITFTDEQIKYIEDSITKNLPYLEMARHLGVARDTITNFCKKNYNYKGNSSRKNQHHEESYIPLLEHLQTDSCITNSKIRHKLIREKYKEEKCELCGNITWLGYKIPLELHHKDFNHWNNNLNNLMIVCPNCHAYLHNNTYNKK